MVRIRHRFGKIQVFLAFLLVLLAISIPTDAAQKTYWLGLPLSNDNKMNDALYKLDDFVHRLQIGIGYWEDRGNYVELDDPTDSIRGLIQDSGGQVYNVLAYGAFPDDSIDDTAAIQAAVDAASGPGNGEVCGTVYFPPGAYDVGESTFVTLKPCVRIVGASSPHTGFGTVIQGAGDTDIFRLCEPTQQGTPNPDCPAYYSPYAIENLTLMGGYDQLVSRDVSTFVTLRDVMFNGPVHSCIHVEGCIEEWRLYNVSMMGGQYGWHQIDNLITGHSCNNTYIDKTTFQDVITGGQTKNNWFMEADLGNVVSWYNPILNMPAEHGMHFDGGFFGFSIIGLNSEGIGFHTEDNNTTGSITAGTDDLTVADVNRRCVAGANHDAICLVAGDCPGGTCDGWDIGDQVTVAGAGGDWSDLVTTIEGVAGLVIDLANNAGTTVTNAPCTTAKWDIINVTNSIAGSAYWSFVNGIFTDLDGVRYSVNGTGANTFQFLNTIGANASVNPIYDPQMNFSVFGGSLSVRTSDTLNMDAFNRTVFPGHNSGSAVDETEQTLIRSPDGRDILLALRDSNGNGTGTYGAVLIRRYDPNRTLVFHSNPDDSVTGGDNFGDYYSRGAWINNGSAFADLGTPGVGTSIYCQDCLAGSDPCSGASTGAWAFRVNSGTPKWKCL